MKKISVSEVWYQGPCCGMCFYAPGLNALEGCKEVDRQYRKHLDEVHPIIGPDDYVEEEVKIVCRKHGHEFL